jgi:hypothetical protein
MHIFTSTISVPIMALLLSSAALAQPSRTFFSETGTTAIKDKVSIDLEYDFDNDANATGIRLGKFGGEVLLNITNAEFAASSIGYKREIRKDIALYGLLSYFNDSGPSDSYTDIAVGIAYTLKLKEISFNFNGEFITDDSETRRGGDNTLFLKAAALLPLTIDNSSTTLILEIAAENNDSLDTGAAFGVRWQPSQNLTTDFILYVDNGSNDATGIPGYIKLNYEF